jgi:hypothetical protein
LKQGIGGTNASFTRARELQALNQHWAIPPADPSNRFLRHAVQCHGISGVYRNARNSGPPRIVAEIRSLAASLDGREHHKDQWQF